MPARFSRLTTLATGALCLGGLSCAPARTDSGGRGWGAATWPQEAPLALPDWSPPPSSPDPHTLQTDLEGAILTPDILDWPILWPEERSLLLARYFQAHKGWHLDENTDVDKLTTMEPKVVVVHWSAGGSARSCFYTFRQVRQTGQRIRAPWNEVNLAAHFIVDRDGTIIRLMPETRMGRHTIGLNHLAIGIENVGDGRDMPLTRAQVNANARLVRYLTWKHGITHLIGHYEYEDFEGHPYFQERFDWFRTGKADPGRPFMAAVRAQLTDLDLAGSPLSEN